MLEGAECQKTADPPRGTERNSDPVEHVLFGRLGGFNQGTTIDLTAENRSGGLADEAATALKPGSRNRWPVDPQLKLHLVAAQEAALDMPMRGIGQGTTVIRGLGMVEKMFVACLAHGVRRLPELMLKLFPAQLEHSCSATLTGSSRWFRPGHPIASLQMTL